MRKFRTKPIPRTSIQISLPTSELKQLDHAVKVLHTYRGSLIRRALQHYYENYVRPLDTLQ
jgi:metal-responsive CopG/Arc/MetJ family transcriptional regulator